MSKPKPTPEAPADGAPDLAPVMAHDLLGDLLQAIVLAVKFPLTPVPRNLVVNMDEALAAFRGGGVAAATVRTGDIVAALPDGVAERLKKLEDFADKVAEDLPSQLAALRASVDALEASAKAGPPTGEQQADLLGEKK